MLAQAIRSHWGIENSHIWVLDVTFREDQSRIRNGHGPENMGLLRRLSLSFTQTRTVQAKSDPETLFVAAMDNDFVVKVLLAAIKPVNDN